MMMEAYLAPARVEITPLFASSIKLLEAPNIMSVLFPLAPCSRSVGSSDTAVWSPLSYNIG
jgi:hypothetical protein